MPSNHDAFPKLWEVFVRSKRGAAHKHVGSVRAADAELALQAARDVYTRRGDVAGLWLIPSAQIVSSEPDERASLFGPAKDKIYRNPDFYMIPDGVERI